MREEIKYQLDALFSTKQSGAMRVALFSKFYEGLLRQYFNHNSYKVCEGEPRIFWKKITVPSEARGSNHLKMYYNQTRMVH